MAAVLDQRDHRQVSELHQQPRKGSWSHLYGVSGLALGLIGALFTVIGLTTVVLTTAGLVTCVAVAVVVWRVAVDYERRRFTRTTLWSLVVCGAAVTFFIVTLSVRVSADSAVVGAAREPVSTSGTQALESQASGPSTSATSTPMNTGVPEGSRADLGELTVVDRSDTFRWEAMTINNKEYPKVFTAGCDGYIEYQLSKKYARFHAEIGISDLSKADTTAEFGIFVDGTRKASKTVSLFMTDTLDVSLAGAQRLGIYYTVGRWCINKPGGIIDPYVVVAR